MQPDREDAQVFEFPAGGRPSYVTGSAAPAHQPEPVDHATAEAPEPQARPLVAQQRRTVRRTTRQTRSPRRLSDAELAARDRVRARRADAVERFQKFAVRHGARAGRGAWIIARGSVRAPARWVWQPKREELIDAMTDFNGRARSYEILTRSRARRGAVLLASGAAAWFARPVFDHLADSFMHAGDDWWWFYPTLGGVVLGSCWAAGQINAVFEQPEDGPELPAGLHDGMSDARVMATFTEAFEAMRVVGRVHKVRAAPRGWGWTVTAEIVSDFGAKELDVLARRLDTPRGGLLMSMPRASTRSRVFRVVTVDLLTEGQAASRITLDSLADRFALAPRYDGNDLELSLAGVHVLVVGRTGSGKSTALWRLVDAFAAARVKLGGIDLSDGPDLRACRAVFDPELSAFGDNAAGALAALDKLIALALDRKSRTPDGTKWRATEADPHVRLIIDEYGMVAELGALLEKVNWLIRYGRNVGIFLVLANQRFLASAMGGDTTVWSQVQVKFIMALDGKDAVQLPKSVRELGVAPELLVPAHDGEANDAGKAYVLGTADETPPLIRFGDYGEGEMLRRANEHGAAGLAQFGRADTAAITTAKEHAADLPRLVSLTRDAIAAVSVKRDPARAASFEIVDYLQRAGIVTSVATLTGQLRKELGAAYPDDRRVDTNLPQGNFKGWHLDDLERGIARYRELNGK